VGAFYEKHAIAIDMVLITAGAAAVKRRLESVHERLDRLEEGGMVPLDDVVTLGDLSKLESRLERAEAVLPIPMHPAPPIDAEVVEEADGPVTAAVGSERPQEGQEGQ
jgi:predicted O-methyltransferase YrrM